MKWWVVKKLLRYKIVCSAREPTSEGPVIAGYPTYEEAVYASKMLDDFESDPNRYPNED